MNAISQRCTRTVIPSTLKLCYKKNYCFLYKDLHIQSQSFFTIASFYSAVSVFNKQTFTKKARKSSSPGGAIEIIKALENSRAF